MSNYIFLDIDGVLTQDPDGGPILPDKVQLINHLVQQLKAVVVLSSYHRTKRLLHENEEMLTQLGGTFSLTSETPFFDGVPRGYEIQIWMTENNVKPSQIVILDDRADMLNLENRLVRTESRVGLLPEHIEQALDIFNRVDNT